MKWWSLMMSQLKASFERCRLRESLGTRLASCLTFTPLDDDHDERGTENDERLNATTPLNVSSRLIIPMKHFSPRCKERSRCLSMLIARLRHPRHPDIKEYLEMLFLTSSPNLICNSSFTPHTPYHTLTASHFIRARNT